jgi:hypothetical protein
MWRKNAFDRFTFPVPVFLKRLAAPLCVFSFGMISILAFGTQPSAFSPTETLRSSNVLSDPRAVEKLLPPECSSLLIA